MRLFSRGLIETLAIKCPCDRTMFSRSFLHANHWPLGGRKKQGLTKCRAAKMALALNGLQVGDRNIRVSLAKATTMSRPAARPTGAYAAPSAYYAPQPAYPGYSAQPYGGAYAGAPAAGYSSYPAQAAAYPAYGAQGSRYPAASQGSSRSSAMASYATRAAHKPVAAGDAPLVARTIFIEHWNPAYNEEVRGAGGSPP